MTGLAFGDVAAQRGCMILQDRLPHDISQPLRLPGVSPLAMSDWLIVDEAYGAQMAERLRLLSEKRETVLRVTPEAMPAAQEALSLALDWLPDGFARDGETVTCPDGRVVSVDAGDPLGTLGALLQEDICLMDAQDGVHVLTGAVLCFPASWTLEEKLGRPLIGIHAPVPDYDADLARRVQRLFDGVQPGRPLWRRNALRYADPTLHQPRREADRRVPAEQHKGFLRSERQSLVRLPDTRAVIFSIHTWVVRAEGLSG